MILTILAILCNLQVLCSECFFLGATKRLLHTTHCLPFENYWINSKQKTLSRRLCFAASMLNWCNFYFYVRMGRPHITYEHSIAIEKFCVSSCGWIKHPKLAIFSNFPMSPFLWSSCSHSYLPESSNSGAPITLRGPS